MPLNLIFLFSNAIKSVYFVDYPNMEHYVWYWILQFFPILIYSYMNNNALHNNNTVYNYTSIQLHYIVHH